jgi:carboxylesterase type B
MTGGGFNNGGIAIPYQLPHNWVQRTQSHIVVTINYRVGIMGFPSAANLTSQNLGILDQRLAVQWVHSNIASFGGDPARITLWGQSAGSASVDAHNFAFYQNPLVSGLFMQSGTAALLSTKPASEHRNFSFVAHSLGCPTTPPSAELKCMRSLPATTIVNFIGHYNDANNGSLPPLTFNPVIDDKIIFANYSSRYNQGLFSKNVPAIIGNAANEGAGLTTYPTTNTSAGPYQPSANAVTINRFICPSHNTSESRRNAGAKTYRYQYAGNFTNVSPRTWMGAYHDSDLPMLFGTYADFREELMGKEEKERERRVSEGMQDAVLAFMRDAEGGLEAVGWPEYGTGKMVRWAGRGGEVEETVDVGEVDGVCEGRGSYDPSP